MALSLIGSSSCPSGMSGWSDAETFSFIRGFSSRGICLKAVSIQHSALSFKTFAAFAFFAVGESVLNRKGR
jgi:hypothetical protein